MKHDDNTAEFAAWLTTDGGYAVAEIMPGGMWVGLHRLVFHWTMHIGAVGDRNGYTDRYCYADYNLALAGLTEWKERGFDGEPKFWRKHPSSDRCRNDLGDPASETIGWPLD